MTGFVVVETREGIVGRLWYYNTITEAAEFILSQLNVPPGTVSVDDIELNCGYDGFPGGHAFDIGQFENS